MAADLTKVALFGGMRREDLGAGSHIDGPAIVAEANATTVVEPEWRATVTPLNHLILRRVQPLHL